MKRINFLILGIFCLLLVGCGKGGSKDTINVEDFQKVSTDSGFVFLDNIGSYSDVEYVKEAKKAVLDSTVIEMIVYDNEENAKKVQESQIKTFKTFKNTAVPENTEEGNNYYKYWMVSNGYYMVSSRIDNTLVFSKTLLANKEKIETILNEINY